MKALVIILFTIWFSGCAEAPVSEENIPAKASPSISVDRQLDEKIALTGNTVYVYPISEALDKAFNQQHRTEIVALIKNYLKEHGFALSEKYAKGYSTLYISADEYKPGLQLDPEAQKFLKDVGYDNFSEGSTITETTETTQIINGNVVTKKTVSHGAPLHRLTIQWDINEYARRPKKWFNFTFASEKSLDVVWADLTKVVRESLDSLKIAPPSTPIKMAGDPGCLPRFGFDETRVVEGSKEFFKITKVPLHSPAQKAGLRVGDILEAIDSIPYSNWHLKEPTDAYEKRVAVPIKFSRNGETKRSMIRAEVMCD